MLLRRRAPDRGIFFALWPRRTSEGLAVGWLHYEWVESWGWGSDGYWRYTPWVPEPEYQTGETWNEEQARLHAGPPPRFYATPPDKANCRNNDGRATVPCWYPHCTCMNIGGSTCGEPR